MDIEEQDKQTNHESMEIHIYAFCKRTKREHHRHLDAKHTKRTLENALESEKIATLNTKQSKSMETKL